MWTAVVIGAAATATRAQTLRWNTTSGAWNTDPANAVWLNQANTPTGFVNGAGVVFGPVSTDATVAIADAGVSPVSILIDHTANTYTFDGGRILSGTLAKTGAGHVVFDDGHSFGGPSNLSGGSIETQSDRGLGSGDVTLSDITWKVTGEPQSTRDDLFVSGTVTFQTAHTLTFTDVIHGGSTATLVFENTSGAPNLIPNLGSEFLGQIHLRSGVLRAATNSGNLFDDQAVILTIDPGAVMDFVANGEGIGGIQGGGSVILNVTSPDSSFLNLNAPGDRTFSGVIQGGGGDGFYQSGGGSLTLSGQSTFTTRTIIDRGAIVLAGDVRPNQPGPLGDNATTIRVGEPWTIAGAALLIGGTHEVARHVQTVGNTNGAAITLGGNTDTESRFTGEVSLGANTRLTSAAAGTRSVRFTGVISSAAPGAGVEKVGPGAVSLEAVNTFSGPTVVNQGTLVLGVPQAVSASAGVRIDGGKLVLGADQTFKALELATQSPGEQAVDLAGRTLRVQDVSGEAALDAALAPPGSGDGIYDSTALANQAVGITDAPGDYLLIRLTRLGDADIDGAVTFTDFQRLELGFGRAGATWDTGDFNRDHVVNFADFLILHSNFGSPDPAEHTALATFATNHVPEPSAAALLGAACLMAAGGRRRPRRTYRPAAAPERRPSATPTHALAS